MSGQWSEPPPHPRARAGAIDVWRGAVGQRGARAMLLDVLGRCTGREPHELRLELAPGGKPRLAGPHGGGDTHAGGVRFNLSHSHELTLVAVSAGVEVGIDVESIDRDRLGRLDEVAIARRMLGRAQAERLAALAGVQRRIEFLRAWTMHEARVKCLGIGIGGAAAERSEDEDDGEDEGEELWTTELDVGPDAIAALAARGGAEWAVRCWLWRPSPSPPVESGARPVRSTPAARGRAVRPSE